MEKKKLNFTDQRLCKLTHDGSRKRLYFYDSRQSGLALQITPAGTKSFQLQTWDSIKGKSVTKTIGRYPKMSIARARKRSAELLDELSNGIDILKAAREKRKEQCLDDVFRRWLDSAKKHKRSWQFDVMRYNKYVAKPLGRKRVSEIDRNTVSHWFYGLCSKGISEATANRIFAIVKTVFNQELPDLPNPCKGIKMYTEYSRERFLYPSELQRFFEALENNHTPGFLKDYVLLSLFTGARKSNILAMRWCDLDLNLSSWTIPAQDSKNKTSIVVPLVKEVVEILNRRRASTSSIFVFPSVGRSKSKTGHLTDPRIAWRKLLKNAELQDVRLHDLRRTLGSYQTMTGASTTIVGKTLGHKSQAATAVYAKLNLDPVRKSMENAVSAMLATQELPEKIIELNDIKVNE